MKVLVCGSRDWTDVVAIKRVIDELPNRTLVIHGAARGADANAGYFAKMRGLFVAQVPCEDEHWKHYGKRAGMLRNLAMLDLEPGLVIAFQRNGSRGTQQTIDEARRRHIPVQVHTGT